MGINYAPESAGIAPYTTAMAETLVGGGLRVQVITGVPHYPHWEIRDSRYRRGNRWEEQVGDVPVTRVRHWVPKEPRLLGRARMEAGFLLRAARELLRARTDVVIGVTPSLAAAFAAVLVRTRRRRVGLVVQDLTGNGALESGTTGRLAGAAIARVELEIFKRADLIGVITERFAEILAKNGVRRDRIVLMPNFTHVEPVETEAHEARTRLGWEDTGVLVVHTGNMGMKQGLESVVHAAQLADASGSNVAFVLVGSGNQRAQLEASAQGIARIRFVDPVAEADYPYVLAAADILLLNERPGVREMSMPSKVTSYVTARRPILAAVETGGITHSTLAEDQAAEIVAPGDAQALLTAAEALSRDGELSSRLIAAAGEMGARRYGRPAADERNRQFAERLLGLA